MRVVVMTLAILSALAGALLVGREAPIHAESESPDIALFV